MKIGGARPRRNANGIEIPRVDPALAAPTTRRDLIAAINQTESIKNVKSCDNASIQIGKAIYGRIMNDVDPVVLEAKTVGGVRTIPDDRQLRTALSFFASAADIAVFHFSIERPVVHHFVLIPWYDETALHGRGYTMYMAYSVLGPDGELDKARTYSIKKYIEGSSGQAEKYKDTWTDDQLLEMLRDLFNSETAWSKYFLSGFNSRAEKISVYKYESIQMERALTRLRRRL